MSNDRVVKTYAAKADYSAKQGYAVFLDDEDAVKNTPVATLCTANARGIGIIVDPPYAADYGMGVCVDGYCKAIAGGTVTVGNPLKADANGALVLADTDQDKVIAIAQKDAASGEQFDVKISVYDLAVT